MAAGRARDTTGRSLPLLPSAPLPCSPDGGQGCEIGVCRPLSPLPRGPGVREHRLGLIEGVLWSYIITAAGGAAGWAEANVRGRGGKRQEMPKRVTGSGAGEGVGVQGRRGAVRGRGAAVQGRGRGCRGGGGWCRGGRQQCRGEGGGAGEGGGGAGEGGSGAGEGAEAGLRLPPFQPGLLYLRRAQSSGAVCALGCGMTVHQNRQPLGG